MSSGGSSGGNGAETEQQPPRLNPFSQAVSQAAEHQQETEKNLLQLIDHVEKVISHSFVTAKFGSFDRM